MRIERVKIFKMTDEPNAPALSEEEYQKIQQEILKNPHNSFTMDLRMREVTMEKDYMSKVREKSKNAKDILFRMIPQMPWRRPYEIKIPINENIECENNIYKGSESEEKLIIESLCKKILGVTYFRDSEIPECPKMGNSRLFSFTDEDIPKIENMKKAYNPDKQDFFDVNTILNTKLTPELVQTLIEKIQNKEFSPDERTKILSYLQTKTQGIYTNNETLETAQPTPTPITNNKPANFVGMPTTFNHINMNTHFFNLNTVNMPPNINPLNNNLNKLNRIPGKQSINSLDSKMNLAKYKTKPCRNFSSKEGCTRGEKCHFIHDDTMMNVVSTQDKALSNSSSNRGNSENSSMTNEDVEMEIEKKQMMPPTIPPMNYNNPTPITANMNPNMINPNFMRMSMPPMMGMPMGMPMGIPSNMIRPGFMPAPGFMPMNNYYYMKQMMGNNPNMNQNPNLQNSNQNQDK